MASYYNVETPNGNAVFTRLKTIKAAYYAARGADEYPQLHIIHIFGDGRRPYRIAEFAYGEITKITGFHE